MKRNPVLLIVLLSTLFADVFLYQGIEILLFHSAAAIKVLWYSLYIIVSIFIVVYLFRIFGTKKHYKAHFLNVYATSITAYFITKFIFALFTAIAVYKVNELSDPTVGFNYVLIGLLLGVIPLTVMFFGIYKGAKKININEIELSLSYPISGPVKLVQISDWHLGSYFKKDRVEEAVMLINELEPDVVVFTGDLVNFDSSEVQGYENILSKIKADHGVYAIMGNHDYSMYKTDWPDEQERLDDVENLKLFYQLIGWDLLLNEKRELHIKGSVFHLLGIENWGLKFHQAGSLEKIDLDESKDVPTILLSHDPTYWDVHVLKNHPQIDLTLSGHTHGFQMGVEYKKVKLSPARLKYKRWAGLYQEGQQYLYVNRGLGFLGYPGRLGVKPEISVFNISNSGFEAK